MREGSILASVELNAATAGSIVQLYKSIDVDGDGTLTEADFTALAADEEDEAAAEGWRLLQQRFDADADGTITLSEFRSTFKGLGVEAKMCAAPPACAAASPLSRGRRNEAIGFVQPCVPAAGGGPRAAGSQCAAGTAGRWRSGSRSCRPRRTGS